MAGAVHFVLLNAPALYAYTLAECLKRYLMAQASRQSIVVLSPCKPSAFTSAHTSRALGIALWLHSHAEGCEHWGVLWCSGQCLQCIPRMMLPSAAGRASCCIQLNPSSMI